jgi:hypothetical protein
MPNLRLMFQKSRIFQELGEAGMSVAVLNTYPGMTVDEAIAQRIIQNALASG